MVRIFVYGTLKNGFQAHHLMSSGESRFIRAACTAPIYEIRHMRWFPAMVEGNHSGAGVIGELYECDEDTLLALDEYEGIATGLFRRAEIQLDDGTTAQAYLYNRGYAHLNQPVLSGLWTEEDVGMIT